MRFYMKLVAVLLLVLTAFLGCMKSKPDTVKVTINFELPEGRSCATYLADHFYVTIYDSNQKKVTDKKVMCDAADEGLTLFLEKDLYYITVALRDANDLYQSYGSGKVDARDRDNEISIKMDSYTGGIVFKWSTNDCKKYTLDILNLSLTTLDGDFASAIIWGEETKLDNLVVPCEAEQLEIINITPEAEYNAELKGFRSRKTSAVRIEIGRAHV